MLYFEYFKTCQNFAKKFAKRDTSNFKILKTLLLGAPVVFCYSIRLRTIYDINFMLVTNYKCIYIPTRQKTEDVG